VAEIVAIQALNFLAGDATRLGLFLAETGIGPASLREAAVEATFLTSVLDFILRDDATAKAFAKSADIDPAHIAVAREILGDPRWERDVP
jgi:hypothetical protein